jgi:hypothetical protein
MRGISSPAEEEGLCSMGLVMVLNIVADEVTFDYKYTRRKRNITDCYR